MIPLMNISSLDTSSTSQIGQPQSLPTETNTGMQRSASTAEARGNPNRGHSRTSSLGGSILRRQDPPSSDVDEQSIGGSPQRFASPQPPGEASETQKALPPVPSDIPASDSRASLAPLPLRPHITSPSADEFLLVVGTTPSEIGIGMFVNVDGDTTRPTIEFKTYPNEVVLDGVADESPLSQSEIKDDDCFVLASVSVEEAEGGTRHGLEIQRWDAGNDATPQKFWLPAKEGAGRFGITSLLGRQETEHGSVIDTLCERRFIPFPSGVEMSTSSLKSVDSRTAHSIQRMSEERELFERDDSQEDEPASEGWEASRIADSEEFIRRLAKTSTNIAVWLDNQIWWATRNPLLLQLDTRLDSSISNKKSASQTITTQVIFEVLASIREKDATSELEFLTYRYIQQKASILLLASLVLGNTAGSFSDGEAQILESVLMESQLDPRVVLSFIPGLRNEIVEGPQGIWIYNGIKKTAEAFLQSQQFETIAKATLGNLESQLLHFLRRFLTAWRKRKGFGSVADEKEVFRTVEASLLGVLLELDRHNLKNPNNYPAVRVELNDIVNKGVDCFDRAVNLLESYHRLFMLSRLYQSRKLSADVLATWRRIIEGERDDGDELVDGEMRVREYLTKIGNQDLVKQYGIWLAQRNPRLGVQVFTEDKGKAPKFEPTQAVQILKQEAPDAVKYYLEHLTFGKGNTSYVNELINYYLDVVLGDLKLPERRDAVTGAYDLYRSLQAPKPSYHHFLAQNAPDDDEAWDCRLRLLQLLGGANEYDSKAINARIASLPGDLLVPEVTILASRERNHTEAIRLLVQKLGDYDSAVLYCLRGGASLFSSETTNTGTQKAVDVEQQRELFAIVLREFLAIEDISSRVEQTGLLLDRFGVWYDVAEVLQLIPDSWTVDVIAGFVVGAMRRIIRDKHRVMIARGLSSAQYLRLNSTLIDEIREKGPVREPVIAEELES